MPTSLKKLEDLISQNKKLEQRNEELRNLIDVNLNHPNSEPQIDFQGLMDLSEVENLILKFYQYNKIPIGLYDDNCKLVFSVGWKNICTKFHRNNQESFANCCDSIKYATKRLKDYRAFYYQCKNGLNAIAIPIEIQKKHIATIVISQFLYEGENPDYLHFDAQAAHFGFNREKYRQAIQEIPVFSRDHINRIAENCSLVAELIAYHARKNLELKVKLHHQTDNDIILGALREKVTEQEKIIKSLHHAISEHQEQILVNSDTSVDLLKEIEKLTSKLDKTENILNSLLTSVCLGIGFIRSGIFTYVNDYMFRLTGYTPKELIGRQPAILLSTKDEWIVFSETNSNLHSNKDEDLTKLKIRKKDGTLLDVAAFIAPIDISLPQKGQIISLLDISGIKKSEPVKSRVSS
jgi:PAS domain S-box-containing protein